MNIDVNFSDKDKAEIVRICKTLCSDETYEAAIKDKTDEEILNIAICSFVNSKHFKEAIMVRFPRRKELLHFPKT